MTWGNIRASRTYAPVAGVPIRVLSAYERRAAPAPFKEAMGVFLPMRLALRRRDPLRRRLEAETRDIEGSHTIRHVWKDDSPESGFLAFLNVRLVKQYALGILF